MEKFSEIAELPSALLDLLEKRGFHTMRDIQAKSIPLILKHKDLIVQSKTGSGKTLAFGIPTVMQVNLTDYTPQTLIITPTRELAQQITTELQKIASYQENLKILPLYGGVPLRPQADSLSKGAHILIGTPGRIEDHLSKGTLSLSKIEHLILDEADRMLEMGFYESILKISQKLPRKRQTLLFSATFPEMVEGLSEKLLHDPIRITGEHTHTPLQIQEYLYEGTDKFKTLLTLIQGYQPDSLLIFCNTKVEVTTLTHKLQHKGHMAIALHGDLDQRNRQEALIAFANGSVPILIATDVASRGLDIKDIAMVVNYDLPTKEEIYTHRIGRTGRAESSGIALSLITPKEHAAGNYPSQALPLSSTQALTINPNFYMLSAYDTLCIHGGKKDKLRAGDILGTLCKEIGIESSMIGKIDIMDTRSYVALHHQISLKVTKALKETKIKKRKYRAWILD